MGSCAVPPPPLITLPLITPPTARDVMFTFSTLIPEEYTPIRLLSAITHPAAASSTAIRADATFCVGLLVIVLPTITQPTQAGPLSTIEESCGLAMRFPLAMQLAPWKNIEPGLPL